MMVRALLKTKAVTHSNTLRNITTIHSYLHVCVNQAVGLVWEDLDNTRHKETEQHA